MVGRAVSDARAFGSLFYAVVLVDEPSAGATTFADGVLDDVPAIDYVLADELTHVRFGSEWVREFTAGDPDHYERAQEFLLESLDLETTVDYVVDMGPGAGLGGGQVVAAGTPAQLTKHRGKTPPKPFGLAAHFKSLDAIEVLDDGTFLVSDFPGNKVCTISADRKTVRKIIVVPGKLVNVVV